MSKTGSVVSSAKLIAICTLISRISGLAREMLFAQTFGLRWVQDAFLYAFQVPNLFRRLLGEGAMAAVFVPTFTRALEEEGHTEAWRLLARTVALLCVTLVGLIILVQLIILAVWLWVPVDPADRSARQLLLSLTAIMLPFMLSICVLALFSAILNCVGSFVPAALAPVVLNIVMIVGVMWLGPTLRPGDPRGQVHVIAWTVIAAGVLQIVFVLPALRASGVKLGWRWEPRDPSVRRMLKLLVPVALGQGVLTFGVYLDAQICVMLTHKLNTPDTMSLFGLHIRYPLEEGALTAITYAQRLYQFPLGVLVISLATAAMPSFSRLAARREWPAWAAEVQQTLRLSLFEGILTGAMMVVLGVPIVRFLFEYRNFTPADTVRTSHVLLFYGLAMWAYCAQHMVLRGFYSMHDVQTPLKISVAVLPLNVVLTLILVWFPGIHEAAFAISSLITSGLSVIVGAVFLQRRAGVRILNAPFALGLMKMIIAGAVAMLAVPAVQPALAAVAKLIPGHVGPRALLALGPLAAGTAMFLCVAWLVGLPEVTLLLRRARKKPVNLP